MAEQTIFDILDRSLGQAIILIMLNVLIGYKVPEKAGTILAVTPVGTSAQGAGGHGCIRARAWPHASYSKKDKNPWVGDENHQRN